MKVVCPDFTSLRVAAAVVKAGTNPALYGLDDLLVFHLNAVQPRTHARFAECGVPDVRVKRHFRATRTERSDDVERQPPGIKVEHEIGEQPEIERSYALTVIRMSGG